MTSAEAIFRNLFAGRLRSAVGLTMLGDLGSIGLAVELAGTACDAAALQAQRKNSVDTVLVVEDSRAMQRTLQRLFEADGLRVQIASDGIAGLESFRKQTPNVVVLDLKLPRLPGKEVCRAGKDTPRVCRSWC